MKSKEIAKAILESLGIIILYLGYIAEIRPFFAYDFWLQGFLDGVILTLSVFLFLFYLTSLFETEKPKIPRAQVVKAKRKAVKPDFIEEMIQRCEIIRNVANQVYQRAGDHFLAKFVQIHPSEETEFKKQIKWLAENYPKIAGELNRATRIEYIDPALGIKVRNYDPLLQTIHYASLRSVYETPFKAKQFRENLDSGISRLRAYLGLIKS